MKDYEEYLDDIAIAQTAIQESMLNDAVGGDLICDVYCIPSHNHQAFYLQIYKDKQYTLLFAKTLISDFLGNDIVMYPFHEAIKADRHNAKRGGIFCGMKVLPLDDTVTNRLIKCLPEQKEVEETGGIWIDGVLTIIRKYESDGTIPMMYHDSAQIKSNVISDEDRPFLDDLYLNIESIIGNLLDDCQLRNHNEWFRLWQLRERKINEMR